VLRWPTRSRQRQILSRYSQRSQRRTSVQNRRSSRRRCVLITDPPHARQFRDAASRLVSMTWVSIGIQADPTHLRHTLPTGFRPGPAQLDIALDANQ